MIRANEAQFEHVPVDRIHRGQYQPRRQFDPDALQELADTVRQHGLIEPIVLRPVAGGYEIIAGERRWRAAQIAGLHELPAAIRDIDEDDLAEITLIENVQREDLNPVEEARAVRALMDQHGYTQVQISERIGKSRTAVANLLRILQLAPAVQEQVINRELSEGAAKTIAGRPEHEQGALTRSAIRNGWNVRRIEKEVRRLAEGSGKPAEDSTGAASTSDQFAAINAKLSEHIGSSARVESKARGGYRLVIETANLDILEGVFEKMGFRFDES
jgi:ParB family chromosome partitioning protein